MGNTKSLKKWFSEADKSRKKSNPDCIRPRRYVTVFGETHEVVTEVETDEVTARNSWLEGGGNQEYKDSVKITVLKDDDDCDD